MNPFAAIKNVLGALQGTGDPRSVAAGFAMGAVLGLVPKDNLFPVLFLLFFFLFRVEKGVGLVSALLFVPFAYAIDPLAHRLGYWLLTLSVLRPLWTFLYNLPVLPWTRFNNTVVLGNLAIGLALFYPLYLLGMRGVEHYRAVWKARVDALPLMRTIKGLYFYRLYQDWTQ